MKKIILLLMAGCSLQASAQKAYPKAEKYAGTITADDLKKHLYIVASAEMEGRETATPGQKKAAAYIENHFKSIGLLPGNGGSYQMDYAVYQDSIISAYIEVGDKVFKLNEDFRFNPSQSRVEAYQANDLVFVGYGIADQKINNYLNINVKDKVVFMLNGEPREGTTFVLTGTNQPSKWSNMNTKVAEAMSKGAKSVMIISPQGNFRPTTNPGRSSMYFTNGEPLKQSGPNAYLISEKLAGHIFGEEEFKRLKEETAAGKVANSNISKEIKVVCDKKTFNMTSSNVLGFLPGTDKKDEVLVISSHYDHEGIKNGQIYYGADDDGSGTVSVLEIAEAFAKAAAEGQRPRRSILFLTVSGEEKGLWGSRYYATYPVYPLEKTVANLNIDMVGRVDKDHESKPDFIYVIGDDKLSSELRPISEFSNKKYTKLDLDYKYNDVNDPNRFYYRSDHYNFAEKGVPIIFYFNGVHADYHKPTDTPDKINYEVMSKRARLVYYTAWDIANRDGSIKRDKNEK